MRMIAAFLAILLLAACSDKDRLPSGILEKDKMEKVLWDMMEADQYASIYLVKDTAYLTKDTTHTNIKMETLRLYQEVFRLHQVTREEFSRSFAYYRNRPDLTRGLFDSLLAKGNRLRTESYSSHSTPISTPSPVLPTTISPNPAKGLIPGPKGLIPGPGMHNKPYGTPGFPHGFPPPKPPIHKPAADTIKKGKGFLRALPGAPNPNLKLKP